MSYWHIHPYTIIGFLAFCLLNALGNVFFVRRLKHVGSELKQHPLVSILVPARNEALNIERCVRSLLEQEYPAFEVLVLDDHSTDATFSILEKIQKQSPALRILKGEPLPAGWLGKHWACHQLAQSAAGELLLFTDADTWHEPDALRDSVAHLLERQLDLLTLFPHEQVITWGEKFTVPVLAFAPFSFVPIFLARHGLPRCAVTIGQFMLFRKSVYEAIGGYEAVRSHPLDDVKFGRRILKYGYQWLLADGTEHVHCRMYRDFPSAAAGLTRSLFAFFTNHLPSYLFAWLWIGVAFLEPLLLILFRMFGFPIGFFPLPLTWIAVAESVLLFALLFQRFRFPVVLAILYPISICVYIYLAFRSLIASLHGNSIWKDRDLPVPTIKL